MSDLKDYIYYSEMPEAVWVNQDLECDEDGYCVGGDIFSYIRKDLNDKAIAERDEYKEKLDKVVDLFNSLYQDTEYILDELTGSDFEKASLNQYAEVLHDEILKTGTQ